MQLFNLVALFSLRLSKRSTKLSVITVEGCIYRRLLLSGLDLWSQDWWKISAVAVVNFLLQTAADVAFTVPVGGAAAGQEHQQWKKTRCPHTEIFNLLIFCCLMKPHNLQGFDATLKLSFQNLLNLLLRPERFHGVHSLCSLGWLGPDELPVFCFWRKWENLVFWSRQPKMWTPGPWRLNAKLHEW